MIDREPVFYVSPATYRMWCEYHGIKPPEPFYPVGHIDWSTADAESFFAIDRPVRLTDED